MLPNPNFRFYLLLTALFIFFLAPALLPAEEPNGAEVQEADQAKQQLDLLELYKWSNLLPRDLVDLHAGITTLTDITGLETQLQEINQQIEELSWEETSLKSDPNLTFHAINSFEAVINRLKDKVDRIDGPIQENISKLESWHKEWLVTEQKLQEATETYNSQFEGSDIFPEFYVLTEIIEEGKELIHKYLRANLLAGHNISKVQTRIYEMGSTAATLYAEMNSSRTQQTSPSMLSADFYQMVSGIEFIQAWDNLRLFLNAQAEQLKQNLGIVVGGLLVIALLAFLANLSGKLVKPSSVWSVFAAKPIVTAIFIFSLSFSLVNPLNISLQIPTDWDMIMYLPLLFSVGTLAEHLFKVKWQARIIKHLLLYFSLTIVLTLINLPSVLLYLVVFYLSVSLFIFYMIQLIRRRSSFASKWHLLTVLFWFIFPLAVIIVGISGLDQLAVVLFGRMLAFVTVTLTIRVMLLFFSGLLEMALLNTPWKLVSNNAAIIVEQVRPLLALLHFILWIATILVISWVYPTIDAAFEAMGSVRIELLSLSATPGSVLTVVLVVYVTLLISRALRAFLLQQVLPYHKVEKGVQISIARLVHYAIMTVGFIVLLKVLGFGMNQITILGGALGVGIGFGLQAIVNNFVSGLILLFERPIKVGDMIDVGNEIGEVKELGLRATTVQTFDNAEVVIPNSQLISANVTNWTLAEKKIRVKVPVGVAYGSDVSEVIRILQGCAEANPIVLSTPKPIALFLAFGSSSLDFELRVWIADFNDKLTVLSELNQDIESEFDAAGIEIPFPQSDLHLRSIDQEAAEKIRRAKPQPSSTESPDTTSKGEQDGKTSPDR